MKKLNLNETYQNYKDNPTHENYELFGGELWQYCAAHVRGKYSSHYDTYEDAIGDAVAEILGNLAKFSGKSAFSTWVYTIVNRAVFRKMSERAARNEQMLVDNIPFSPFEDIETKLTVKKILSTLNSEDRELIAGLLLGYTEKEIADNLGSTHEQIRQRWLRLKRQIAQYDKNYYDIEGRRIYNPEETLEGHLIADYGDGRKLLFPTQKWSSRYEAKKI